MVKKRQDLAGAIKEAFKYDDEVMIERFVPGRELTVGVLGNVALPVGEIIPKHEIYDYECKYTPGMATEEFPAKISREATERVQQQALAAFKALKLGMRPDRFQADERRRVLLSRGEHVARDDRAQSDTTGRGGDGNQLPGAVRADSEARSRVGIPRNPSTPAVS